ncbi:MAG: ArsA family ATPase [Acidimicrobiia bacterium]|nr:ArsA family ATPase [Acidimicrobiia bacterium]
MRVVLVTGKGGVGKTTVAAATGLRAAELGHRTLVTSTDPAHSLADAFDVPLGDVPSTLFENLDVQQIDAQLQLAKHWGELHQQLKRVFDWGGVKGIEAEEFLVFPGMDELFSLLQVKDHVDSGSYDTIIVDCAPTAETLRLLSLPEVLSWYFDRVLPTERRLMKAARPVLTRMTNLPVPGEDVFDAAEGVFLAVEGVKALLSDSEITSARLVVNPEKMVVNEARRTYTYLGLFGYGVDAVVVNRVLPASVSDSYFDAWREVQARHLAEIEESFREVSILPLRLFGQEMVGVDRLRELAAELYGDTDPITGFKGVSPFTLTEDGEEVIIELAVPFADEEELDVLRRGAELYITVGPYRRSFVLPDSLLRRRIAGAKLSGGVLRVTFVG